MVDVQMILDVWDWILHRAGRDGEPAWCQTNWAEQVDGSDEYYQNEVKDEVAIIPGDYCGTAYCVAGYILKDKTGADLRLIKGEKVKRPNGLTYTIQSGVDWEDAAAARLGIDLNQAAYLFSGGNDLGDIHRILQEILDDAGHSIVLEAP